MDSSPTPYMVLNGRPRLSAPQFSPVSLDDILRLNLVVRSLLSDLFVLHGTFLPQNRDQDPENVAEFENTGFADALQFYKYEERLASFRIEVENRVKEQAAELPDFNRNWSDALAAEHRTLAKLYRSFDRCRSRLTSLRELLETRHMNGAGIYEYEIAVNYQEIGNQVKPPGYRKPKSNSAASRSKTSSPAPSTTSESTNSKKRGVTSDLRLESEHNDRAAKKVKSDSTGSQPEEDSVSATAPTITGSPLREPIRTMENVGRDIAWRKEQIALNNERIGRLNNEILELRWEKKVLAKGREA
ncbi:hypothetical protein BKA65DRAFT_591111 [Rhexocercosporidium sp. MPI-PUGE-AT-0058]|nr:hypothetical protein BKA65DRAFT_591111 [Rhexocercosporidium sp. MPI-PUGE-AT-0058]